jgi:tetratricopeptide (TPR) repeat protein
MSTRARFHAFALSAALAALAFAPAFAQGDAHPPTQGGPPTQDGPPAQDVPPPPGGPPSAEPLKPVEPPEELPKVQAGDPKQNLDRLFRALKIAPSDESAKFFENRIWALWLAAGGDTGTLLMSRVKTAMDKKDFDLAIKLLNAIVDFRSDYVEAWNRRATVYYMKKDFENAISDIGEVLKREPRHFGALSGLGMIMQELGDEKAALQAFRRAIEVHPKLEKIPDMVKKLSETVEGRPI